MARKNTKAIRAGEEFVGLMDRVRDELNLKISDPECTNYIARRFEMLRRERKR